MSLFAPTTHPLSTAEEMWTTAFNELSQRIRQHFVRQEPYHQALAYVRGLMSPVERKNGWQVAEEEARRPFTACAPADPLESTCARLPQRLDQGRQGSEKASNDEATGCAQTEP